MVTVVAALVEIAAESAARSSGLERHACRPQPADISLRLWMRGSVIITSEIHGIVQLSKLPDPETKPSIPFDNGGYCLGLND
jgi:hypothetical protein